MRKNHCHFDNSSGQSGKTLYKLNATTASLSDIKDIAKETGGLLGVGGILLYLDEIQYFNKKQQQSLLEYLEDGRITLIASTTENPYYYIYDALLQRSFRFLNSSTFRRRILKSTSEKSPRKHTLTLRLKTARLS